MVCNAIYALQSWPKWWPSVKSIDKLSASNSDGVGGCYRFLWRGALPFSLEFVMHVTQFRPSRMIEGHITGDVKGIRTWFLFAIE